MKVAIVHDDLMQWGGAERVLEVISEIYPEAPIFTSVFNDKNLELKKRFGGKEIVTSFLQRIPGWQSFYKALLPLYPMAFEQFNFDSYDLVISHTTRFAKVVITKPETTHICYCHTPPRFLWHFSGEVSHGFLDFYLSNLRIYDQVSANRVDYFLAGSKNAQRRIKRVYKVDSDVVFPFVDLGRFKEVEGFDGGYFLVISRLNKYKRVDLAVEACGRLGIPLKVVGKGPEEGKLRVIREDMGDLGKVEFLGHLGEEEVVRVLAGCRGLIVCGEEDFGLTPLEAQALGKPVISFGVGGVLETVVEGKTGEFFKEQTVESLTKVLQGFNHEKYSADDCRKNAEKFSKDNFIKTFKEKVAEVVQKR